MKKLFESRSVIQALSVLALFSVVPRLASAEIGNCTACNLAANTVSVPTVQPALTSLDLLGWNNGSWLNQGLRVAPLNIPTYQQSPMTAISAVDTPSSPTRYASAPIIPSTSSTFWTGGALPNAFQRPWELPQTDYNPAFITSFAQNGSSGFLDLWTAPLSPLL